MLLQSQHGAHLRDSSPAPRIASPRSPGNADPNNTYRNPLAGGSLLSPGRGDSSAGAQPQSAAPQRTPVPDSWNEQSDYIAHYMQALQASPTDPGLHNVLGVALAKHGSVEMAIKHYNTALQHDSTYFAAHYNLGRAKYRLGQLEDAVL
eukprot:SAG31_NODE_10302_length_1158_cov_0.872521_1_plen_148_part_10